MKKNFKGLFGAFLANTPPCKKELSSLRFLSLFLILFLAVGNVWAETEIFSFTATSSTTTKGTYSATGGTAEIKGANFSTGGSNEITVGSQTFYKFSSSTEVKFTLTSGTFAVGDVISFTCACTTSNKTGKGVAIQTSPVITVTGDFPKNESNTISYTVAVNDGVAGESSFSIKRNDSDIKFGTVSVTRADAGGEPVCPETLTITSKDSKTAFLEGDAIELTAALSEGNGAITYQWYKGGTAEGNKLAGKTAAKLEIASCVEGDAGDYYCIASKDDCSDAVNAAAFAITVAHNPCATHHWFVATADATANGKINWSGFTNPPTGSNNQNNSVTIDGKTYTLTKRTGSVGGGQNIIGFTIPANKTGTLYGYMKSSGSTGRTLSLKKDDDVIKTNTEITGSSWTLITIDAIAPGTYTLSPDQNVQVQMFVLKICDATFYTITFNSNGGSTVADLSVLDGTTAIQPTDPTWEHHRFDGWYNGETPYDWTANVTGDLTLTAHWTQLYTITYAAGDGTATGDAPMQVDKAEGETFTVAANTFEVAGKDFVKWNDGTNDYAPGATYTVGTDNVVLTAQWKAAADKYTVKFMDGTTELGTKLFDVTTNPSDADIDKTKALNTFAAWQKEGVDIALDDAFWATVAKDAEITLTARWEPKYATSLDFAAITTAGTTGDNPIVDFLASGNMVASNLGGSEWETSTSKSGYVGYKLKNEGATITFLVQGGKRVMITFGSIGANVTLKKGEESVTISAASGDNAETVYPALDVATDMLITLTTTSGSTVTLKSITIGEIPAISDDATLQDLKVDGTTIEGFNSATKIYYFTVPYGTEVASMPKITNAVANHGSASVVIYPTDGPEWTNEYGGCYLQQIVVTAEDNTTKGYYHVRTTVDAKEGVTIIKATHTGAATADVTGYIGGSVDKNTQAGGKLGSNGHYFGIKLAEGSFLADDIVKIYADNISSKVQIFSDKGTTIINEGTFDGNYFTYALTEGTEWIYLYRTEAAGSSMNPTLGYIEVQRFMDPFIETFEVAGTLGVVNQSTKTITIEVPASTDVISLTPTITAWANGGATVTPVGAQDFTNPVTYSVFSAYAEDGVTTYTVTINKAAASTDATLQELTINGTAIPLVAGQYEYEYELPYGTTTAPEVVAEANDANATAVVTSVSLTEAVITITAENGATQEYVINFTVSRAISYVIYDGSVQQNIEESGTGLINWGLVQASSTEATAITTTCNGKSYTNCVNVFTSATASDKRYMTIIIPDGYMAKFYLAGATNSNGDERSLFISKEITSTLDQSIAYSTSSAYAGAAMLSDYQMAGTYYLCCNKSIRLYELSVLLYPIDYARDVNAGRYGTICLPNKGQMIGAAVYEIAYMDYKDGAPYKIYFDEILNGKMEAGVPYVFLPNEGYNQLIVTYTAIFNAAAADANGLYGFIGASATDEYQIPSGVGNYIIQNNQYREVLAGADARIVSNRAYIKLSEVPGYNDPLYVAPAPAPGRKRIAMGTTGAQVATGVDQVQGDEVPTKMIINGQLFILRGEKMYDAQGKLVR